jgi:hypothetical protein
MRLHAICVLVFLHIVSGPRVLSAVLQTNFPFLCDLCPVKEEYANSSSQIFLLLRANFQKMYLLHSQVKRLLRWTNSVELFLFRDSAQLRGFFT